jgi:hypothetical protein
MGLRIVGGPGAGASALMGAAAALLSHGIVLDLNEESNWHGEKICNAEMNLNGEGNWAGGQDWNGEIDSTTGQDRERTIVASNARAALSASTPALLPLPPPPRPPLLPPLWCARLPATALFWVHPTQAISRLRDCLAACLAHAPSLLFLDGLDAAAPAPPAGDDPASPSPAGIPSLAEAIAELLLAFGRDPRSRAVCFVATCHGDETLAGCLTQPGLFECALSLAPLDTGGREAALRAMALARGLRVARGAMAAAAGATEGFTAGELNGVMRGAAAAAAARGLEARGEGRRRGLGASGLPEGVGERVSEQEGRGTGSGPALDADGQRELQRGGQTVIPAGGIPSPSSSGVARPLLLCAIDFRRAIAHACRASDRPAPLAPPGGIGGGGGGGRGGGVRGGVGESGRGGRGGRRGNGAGVRGGRWSRARGLDTVGGLRAAKETLREALLLPLAHPALFALAPLRLRSGALLHGPAGCGKTMLARAVAEESGLPFICIQVRLEGGKLGYSWVGGWRGHCLGLCCMGRRDVGKQYWQGRWLEIWGCRLYAYRWV